MRMLITGAAGFIGCNFLRHVLQHTTDAYVVALDALTYAGSLANLRDTELQDRYVFVRADINDLEAVRATLAEHAIDTIVHLAAESHVDRSIADPGVFIQTNIVGTFNLLRAARELWQDGVESCRFLHVSTDEVYGSLQPGAAPFCESSPYAPNSPYAASKAAADHLVRSYHKTYGLPVITTHCSNNYGPYQHPEKLIPLMIINGLGGKSLPIYGDGQHVRDWLYVGDHCRALWQVLCQGQVGHTYNIGGNNPITNLEIVHAICDILDARSSRADPHSHRRQIVHISDRPGHDRRYALDISKIASEVGWTPRESLKTGLQKTVQWYVDHSEWVGEVTGGDYQRWIAEHYQTR